MLWNYTVVQKLYQSEKRKSIGCKGYYFARPNGNELVTPPERVLATHHKSSSQQQGGTNATKIP